MLTKAEHTGTGGLHSQISQGDLYWGNMDAYNNANGVNGAKKLLEDLIASYSSKGYPDLALITQKWGQSKGILPP